MFCCYFFKFKLFEVAAARLAHAFAELFFLLSNFFSKLRRRTSAELQQSAVHEERKKRLKLFLFIYVYGDKRFVQHCYVAATKT